MVPARRPRARGTAEIELLLVIPVLIVVLLLLKASFKLGVDRLSNVYNAEEKAYRHATAPSGYPAGTDTGLLDPVTGFTSEIPTFSNPLPNRMHVSEEKTTVAPPVDFPLTPITLTDRAAFAGTPWAYSAWPTGDNSGFQDATITRNWFADYAAEVRDETITESLLLTPSSPP